MKKYIIPEIEIIDAETQQMLATSALDIDSTVEAVDPATADAPELIIEQ